MIYFNALILIVRLPLPLFRALKEKYHFFLEVFDVMVSRARDSTSTRVPIDTGPAQLSRRKLAWPGERPASVVQMKARFHCEAKRGQAMK